MKPFALALLLLCSPVAAEQYAIATDDGDTVELHDRVHNKCSKGVKEAVYVYKGGHKIAGCWKHLPDVDAILLVFEDGDSFMVKTGRFTWKANRKPATL